MRTRLADWIVVFLWSAGQPWQPWAEVPVTLATARGGQAIALRKSAMPQGHRLGGSVLTFFQHMVGWVSRRDCEATRVHRAPRRRGGNPTTRRACGSPARAPPLFHILGRLSA